MSEQTRMQDEPSISAATGLVIGASGLTFPWWGDVVTVVSGVNQWLLAIGGLIVLMLTIRKLWIENKIAERRLRGDE